MRIDSIVSSQKLKIKQAGLTLVEVMIVLVVIGLLVGASLVPFGSIVRQDAYESEQQRMESFHDAILGYAMRNQTQERSVEVGVAPDTREFTLPEGRPYLPCPDIDGDGFEDREDFDVYGLKANFEESVKLTINATDNDIVSKGNCAVTRGVLPWRTLGINPHDRWGNRYTYEVDDVYANAISGFDESSSADIFDPRLTVNVDSDSFQYAERSSQISSPTVNTIERGGVLITYQNERNPIVVCDGQVSLCLRSEISLQLDAGAMVTAATLQAPRKKYVKGDVISGVPYAIVSHGFNGYGAVGHHINVTTAVGVTYCNFPVDNGLAANAGDIKVEYHQEHEATNFPFVENTAPNSNRFCNPVQSTGSNNLKNGHFVNAPLTDDPVDGREFDDIVIWGNEKTLVRQLSNQGALPAKRFPLLGSY